LNNAIYFSNLTFQEKECGFTLEKVQNPDTHLFLAPSMVSAVVKTLCHNQRLIKMKDSSSGLVIYAHQIKLTDSNHKDPWRAIADPANSLEQACERAPLTEKEIS